MVVQLLSEKKMALMDGPESLLLRLCAAEIGVARTADERNRGRRARRMEDLNILNIELD